MSAPPRSRRALVVACNFPPDASVGTMRTLRLVRHLHGEGWAVDVVTISPGAYRPGTVSDPALLERVPAGVTVLHATPLRPFERLTAAIKRLGRRGKGSPAASATAPAQSDGAATTGARMVGRPCTAGLDRPHDVARPRGELAGPGDLGRMEAGATAAPPM